MNAVDPRWPSASRRLLDRAWRRYVDLHQNGVDQSTAVLSVVEQYQLDDSQSTQLWGRVARSEAAMMSSSESGVASSRMRTETEAGVYSVELTRAEKRALNLQYPEHPKPKKRVTKMEWMVHDRRTSSLS